MHRYMRGMSYGGGIASDQSLTDEQLRQHVPSIFAEEPHESRSDRFAYIPTALVLDGLRKAGFDPFFAQQSRSRVPGKQDFTKHMVRLRHQSRRNDLGEVFEIILLNAHDGTSSYQMIPGVFRFVCANGLMTGDTFGEVKIRHSGDAVNKVIEGAYEVLETADDVLQSMGSMKLIELSEPERLAFATSARKLRYDDPDKAPVTSEELVRPRRVADQFHDLWTTFNVVQEHLLKGGQRGLVRDANGRQRRAKVREIKGIDQKKSLNRALWTLAEEMQKLKVAA